MSLPVFEPSVAKRSRDPTQSLKPAHPEPTIHQAIQIGFRRVDADYESILFFTKPPDGGDALACADFDDDRALDFAQPGIEVGFLKFCSVLQPATVTEHQDVRAGDLAAMGATWQIRNQATTLFVNLGLDVFGRQGQLKQGP